MEKVNLSGLTREEIKDLCISLGQKEFRSKQLWNWIYTRGETDIDKMTSISKDFRLKLKEVAEVKRLKVVADKISKDKTRKWLLQTEDGHNIETVYIPEEGRGSICVSSQVGCAMGCKFCYTGTQRIKRNLTAAEIINQVLVVRDAYKEHSADISDAKRTVSNIVMMGMGEPLQNYKNVSQALKVIMDGEGIGFSKRRITLSTCGIVPYIDACGEELGVNLAVSFHAPFNDLRTQIMPINRQYSIEKLVASLKRYPKARNSRKITIEYVMLKGINDSDQHAIELVNIFQGMPIKFNLIPFNPWPGTIYERSSNNRIRNFATIIMKGGFPSPIRATRGEDIMAACGQLKSDFESKKIL